MYGIDVMATHNKWYPAAEDVIVPWNARYAFPGQANKAIKTTPRITPKNGANFGPGNVIRLEFPAQGYVNPRNTTIAFDVVLTGYGGGTDNQLVRFQNNIQSIFQRARLLYGSTPLEDIINYNVIVRSLTEWTANSQMSGALLSDGIASVGQPVGVANLGAANTKGTLHPRQQTHGQTHTQSIPNDAGRLTLQPSRTYGALKRYQVQLAFGLFTQDKLIPVKFMASQLAIELTLAEPTACIYVAEVASDGVSLPTYEVQNVTLIPEILEFDSSYDAMFLKGLKEGGVPIKFSSWHTYSFALNGASANVQIQERSRSVKSIFTVQRIAPDAFTTDSHATLFHSNTSGTLQNYQYRIGGRYYPAAPVQTSVTTGSSFSNGAAEAYTELQKALKTLGDFRLSNGVNDLRWGYPATQIEAQAKDGERLAVNVASSQIAFSTEVNIDNPNPQDVAMGTPSMCYCSAINLETTDGIEISGLNAEEQSDIIFQAQWSNAQNAGYVLESYVYYDAMLILRENNVVELVQ